MPRTNPYRDHTAQYEAMTALQDAVSASDLDHRLAELCKLRASQLNGCAFCLAMHSYETRQAGESEARLHVLAAWRELPQTFTPAERAALALTEAVTLLPGGVGDDVWDAAVAELGEHGANDVLWLAVTINAWNRLAVTTHATPAHWRDELGLASSSSSSSTSGNGAG